MWIPALLFYLSTRASLKAQELSFPSCIPSVIIKQTFLLLQSSHTTDTLNLTHKSLSFQQVSLLENDI